MHQSAYLLGKRFFDLYAAGSMPRILEIGSLDVNGSLRAVAPPHATYVGVDLTAGAGVDIVLQDAYDYPFDEKSFDVIVSTSTFEHDKLFWLTFLECCRVLSDSGFLYVNTPSNGSYHGYPLDCWRFYPDAALALQTWAKRMLQPVRLIESFVAPQFGSEWNDYVMVFTKRADYRPARFLSAEVQNAHNIRRGNGEMEAPRSLTQDQVRIVELQRALAGRP